MRFIIFWIFLLTTCGYAIARGRRYEKLAAITCLIATIASMIGHMLMRHYYPVDYSAVEISDLIVDTGVLAAFVAIALRSDRFWPLWAAGLQLTISMSHTFKAIEPSLPAIVYGAAERFWAYPTLLVVFIGAWRQHRRSASLPAATPA